MAKLFEHFQGVNNLYLKVVNDLEKGQCPYEGGQRPLVVEGSYSAGGGVIRSEVDLFFTPEHLYKNFNIWP